MQKTIFKFDKEEGKVTFTATMIADEDSLKEDIAKFKAQTAKELNNLSDKKAITGRSANHYTERKV